MSQKHFRLISVLVIALLLVGAFSAAAQGPVTVTWFVGLGTGGDPAQQEAQEAVVAAFNEANDDIELVLQISQNSVAADTLSTLIASGQAPDIVGPVGNDGANGFAGSWADLTPLIEESGYDLSQFPEGTVSFYQTPEGQFGIPFAVYPSFIYYRPGLFDEAGLSYPPANVGDAYVMPDGSEVEWNTDTLREIGMLLTVDGNGNDASMDEFDPENVVQWGFVFQWSEGRATPTLFGAETMLGEDGSAVMPDNWRAAWQWIYDATWTDYFIPNAAQQGSDALAAGNPFSSGNVAMAQTHLWYTCCLADTEWQAAVLPSHNGKITSKLHADTFRLYKDSANPSEAFEVMTYLLGEGSLPLLSTYGALPARESDREAWFAIKDAQFTQGVNWDSAMQMLAYPDSPNHEEWLPNYLKTKERILAFESKLRTEAGLDVNAEIDTLLSDLNALWAEAQ